MRAESPVKSDADSVADGGIKDMFEPVPDVSKLWYYCEMYSLFKFVFICSDVFTFLARLSEEELSW